MLYVFKSSFSHQNMSLTTVSKRADKRRLALTLSMLTIACEAHEQQAVFSFALQCVACCVCIAAFCSRLYTVMRSQEYMSQGISSVSGVIS